MSQFFNDSPIERPEQDRYGFKPYAENLARVISNISGPHGTVLALHGRWGAGKSSVTNLLRHELLKNADNSLVVTEFKSMWFRGEEALALAFMQELQSTLRQSLGEEVGDQLAKISKRILQAGPALGAAISTLTGQSWIKSILSRTDKFAEKFFPDEGNLEQIFQRVSEILQECDRRFLVIIDDMDRLSAEEALAIFRLVKSVGRLPNVMYLVVFDRELAENHVALKYPSEGPHYLEKIVQVGFNIPDPLQTDLNGAVLRSIEEICGVPPEEEFTRTMNVFFDVVAPRLTSPRHVTRFENAISATWPPIAGDVNLADYVSLEVLRLYEPSLFSEIVRRRHQLCARRDHYERGQRGNDLADEIAESVNEDRRPLAKDALLRLFPSCENIVYDRLSQNEWSASRRVCVEKHFNTYLRLSLSDETVSKETIDLIVDNADEAEFIQVLMRGAAKEERRNGQSAIPVYLDELIANAKSIPVDKVAPFLRALFEIHDEIDLERDKERGFMSLGETTMRYHWLIRALTRDRCTLEQRTEIYLNATERASVGWLADFVNSARRDYMERDGEAKTPESNCLVTEDALPELTERALDAIRESAQGGNLLSHKDLIRLLYCWRDFMGNDPSEVRKWTDPLLDDEEALVLFARKFTGESWTMGLGMPGSPGDRISKAKPTAQISEHTDIIDTVKFRENLERLLDQELSDNDRDSIETFLSAWDRAIAGDED